MTNTFTKFAFLTVAFMLASTSISQAITINLALDKDTRSSIEGLPEAMGKAIVETIEKSMPLIDKSVVLYLKESERIGKELLGAVNCTGIQAGSGTLKEAIADGIKKGTWRNAGPQVGPIAEANRLETEALGSIKADMTPLQIADVFGDLTFFYGVQVCRADGVSESVEGVLADRLKPLEAFHLMWEFIKGSCDNADDCLSKRPLIVAKIIERSDQRDVETADAKNRLKAVKIPDFASTVSKSRSSSRPIPIELYNGPLLDLQNIELSIAAALNARQKAAEEAKTAAKTKIEQIESNLIESEKLLSKNKYKSNNEVIKRSTSIEITMKELEQDILKISQKADKADESEKDFNNRLNTAKNKLAEINLRAKTLNEEITARAILREQKIVP